MSYIGHGLSHAIFGGFAASALLGVNFFLGAGVWGVASALMISGVTRRRIIGADAAIGVITTASFALGLALFAMFGSAAARTSTRPSSAASSASSTADVLVVACVTVGRRARRLLPLPGAAVHDLRPRGGRGVGREHGRVDALLMVSWRRRSWPRCRCSASR